MMSAWEEHGKQRQKKVDHRIGNFSFSSAINGWSAQDALHIPCFLDILCSSMLDVSTRVEGMHEFASNQVTTNI